MHKLALLGGDPVISTPLRPYSSVGEAEEKAVSEVMKTGILSGFYGSWGEQFLGGPKVKELEAAWSKLFKIKYAVSMNSATSCLMAAMGAIGLEPGDEVIVPPATMSATAIAPLIYGGIPIFVDIEPDTFCLDLQKVKLAITPKTKAIIVVNLFGHPARLKELRALADERQIKLIEDNAQSILATEQGHYAGTIGHIGVFSLNYHKHIHCGEGGICVTNDSDLASRLQMIRNHAENIVEPLDIENISGLVGFNYRLSELAAAIALTQLEHIEDHIGPREQAAKKILDGISNLEGIHPSITRSDCRSVFYVVTWRIDQKKLGLTRDEFSKALSAEGFPHFNGYVKPLYHLPIFQKRIAFGSYPFNLSSVTYTKNLCPIYENLYAEELMCFENCMYNMDENTVELLIKAIRKVHHQRKTLCSLVSS